MLSTHWKTECDHKDKLKQCNKCKEIMPEEVLEKHTVELTCPPNPKNDPKCALCGAIIPKVGNKEEDGW